MALAAEICRENGARKIYVAFTHGLLVSGAIQRLENSPIEKIFMSDTVPLREESRGIKTEVVSVAPLFGEAIRCINSADSISSIFN
jgi:ribose-phosphate pyrophosphokinase